MLLKGFIEKYQTWWLVIRINTYVIRFDLARKKINISHLFYLLLCVTAYIYNYARLRAYPNVGACVPTFVRTYACMYAFKYFSCIFGILLLLVISSNDIPSTLTMT